MKIHTKMPKALNSYYQQELRKSKLAFAKSDFRSCWLHLERAHILGQPYPIEHTAVHWKMLLFGFKTKNSKEIIGQLPRLLVGGVKSFVGKIPVGNTGGANVPPLKPMEIPDDLIIILQQNQ